MSEQATNPWDDVAEALEGAVSIAWEGCHKIYVLMDEGQHREMESLDYPNLLRVSDIGVEEAMDMLMSWYELSCPLKFISAVKTVDGGPNEGFSSLIPQCYEEVQV